MVAKSKYYIRSVAQPDLVLQAYSGKAVVGWIDPTFRDLTQQWFMFSNETPQTIANVGTGDFINASSMDQGTLLTMGGAPATAWMRKVHSAPEIETRPDEATYLIHPEDSNSQVINLPGPNFNLGTQLALWVWSKGETNELWRIEDVGSIEAYRSDLAFLASGNPQLALGINGAGQASVKPSNEQKILDTPEFLWTLTYWTSGISLTNKKSGLRLAYGGMDLPLVQNIQMANQSVWTPIANDFNQYRTLARWDEAGAVMRTIGPDSPADGNLVNTRWSGSGTGSEAWGIKVYNPEKKTWEWFTPHPRDQRVIG